MDVRRWRVIDSVYHAVLAKMPGERTSYLEAACAEEPSLRSEIESLLAYADAQLANPVERADILKLWDRIETEHLTAASTKVDETSGLATRIGRYRILRALGEGGMGVVYEAEQEQPRRIVALKVIKPGLAGPEQLRRFEQEAEALGRLQHTGIAQVYEAGTADSGSGLQPYFAMELIRGESISKYAESHQLSTRQRLESIAKVCDAVHHAHQRGIIHRDLKPANILVDESGQPKVLDFGVAHVTDSDAQATRQTYLGQIVGTLTYMSPEQVMGDPLELDTRSDVYSLGVILYELLTGRLPYQVSGQLHEAVRTIREQDPVPLHSISRVYRGDIETIIGKALEKDKTCRYASAAALADDIRRFLNDEPIMARPPRATYQMRKFAKRHRALVAGAAAVFVVLIAGIVASTWEAARARKAEQAALRESATAKAVNDFLQNDLLAQASVNTQARPGTKPDPDLKVRTALDRAAAGIAGKFKEQPLVEASIRQTIGLTYMDLGLYPQAQQQLDRTLYLRRATLGEGHRDTLETMNDLAQAYLSQGKYAQAEPISLKVLEAQRRLLGEQHSDTLGTMNNLAMLYRREGKYPQAEQMYTSAVEGLRRSLGEENELTLTVMNNLADVYSAQGKYPEAERLFTHVLELDRRVLGEEHPNTLLGMNNLALVYGRQGKYLESEALYKKALQVQQRVLGEQHPNALVTLHNLATLYRYQGQYAKAEPLFVKVAETRRQVLGEQHASTLMSIHNLAQLYCDEQKYAQAETLFADALKIQQRVLGPNHPDTLTSMNDLAELYRRQGKYVEAEALFNKAVPTQRRILSEQHPDTLLGMSNLAALYLGQHRYVEAETLLRPALSGYEKRNSHAWGQYNCQSMLGASLAGQKKYEQAEPLLVSGYKGMVEREATIPAFGRSKIKESGRWLVQLYEDWGKPDQATAWRERLHSAVQDR